MYEWPWLVVNQPWPGVIRMRDWMLALELDQGSEAFCFKYYSCITSVVFRLYETAKEI